MSGLDGVARYHDINVRKVEDRLSRILTCVAAGLASPFVRDYVTQLRTWGRCGPRNYRCMVPLGHYTIANLVQYTNDPPDRDVFKSLEVVRREAQKNGKGRGDCGTYTACLDTVFAIWGFDVGCDIFAQSPSWDHVAAKVRAPGVGEILLDASVRPLVPPAWEPPPTKYWLRRTYWFRNLGQWVEWWMRGARNEDMPPI